MLRNREKHARKHKIKPYAHSERIYDKYNNEV